MSHAATVQSIYAAFGRGDVPAILEHLAEDVDWEYAGAVAEVPYLQRRRGRAAVAGFFQALGGLEFVRFVPKELVAGPGVVVAIVDIEAIVKGTGKRIAEDDELHLWRFDDRGRVVRFRHGVDTHAHVLAHAR